MKSANFGYSLSDPYSNNADDGTESEGSHDESRSGDELIDESRSEEELADENEAEEESMIAEMKAAKKVIIPPKEVRHPTRTSVLTRIATVFTITTRRM